MWENIDALNEEWVVPYDGICTFELFPGSSVEVGFSYSIIRYAQKTGKIYELRSKIVSYTENVPYTEKVPYIVTVEEQEEYTLDFLKYMGILLIVIGIVISRLGRNEIA